MFIVVAGPIGVGKSTVTRIYSQITGYDALFENFQGNPYLEEFYKNPSAFAFKTQAFFLWDRFNKHYQSVTSKRNVVADRSIYEDAIFAKVLNMRGEMDDNEYYRTYLPHFKILTNILPPPDLTIYLRASLDTLLYRIRKRSREMEKDIDVGYMKTLSQSYEEWIEEYPHKKLIVETDDIDLTCDLHHEWYLFFKAIHHKVMSEELPNKALGINKLREELPEIFSADAGRKAKAGIFK